MNERILPGAASIKSTGLVARSWLGLSMGTSSAGEGAQVVAVDHAGLPIELESRSVT